MRAFLVKFAGLALYVHKLQSGTLTLLHERPNKRPTSYALDEEDFEENVDELDDEAAAALEPALEASAVGLSVRLIKNDGVLKVIFEGEHGGVVDWRFQGLRDFNEGSMTACAFTQTTPEVSLCCGGVGTVPPELSTSTIQTVSTYPTPECIVRPPPAALSIISISDTRPTPPPTKRKCSWQDLLDRHSNPKRQEIQDAERLTPRLTPHERAKSSHDSPPWPNHLYMTCFRIQPISKSDVGTLHIDLVEGTVWFEGWHGNINARTFERKQVNLQDVSTSVGYCAFHGNPERDGSTHYLSITKLRASGGNSILFYADCSAPGWQTWGSDTDTSPGPIPTLTVREDAIDKKAGIVRSIPRALPTGTTTEISPTVIVDALVHCVDRATSRQPVHDPKTEHKLLEDLERISRSTRLRFLTTWETKKWESTVKEVKRREACRRELRTVDGEDKTDQRTKLEYYAANGAMEDSE